MIHYGAHSSNLCGSRAGENTREKESVSCVRCITSLYVKARTRPIKENKPKTHYGQFNRHLCNGTSIHAPQTLDSTKITCAKCLERFNKT